MPLSSVRTSRKTANEVIDLVSSSEEEVKPARISTTGRKPLTPRTKLPARASVMTAKGRTSRKDLSRKPDIKPIVIQDDEDDIFARLLSGVNTPAKAGKTHTVPSNTSTETHKVKKEVEDIKPTMERLEKPESKKGDEIMHATSELSDVLHTPRHRVMEDVKPKVRGTPLFLPASPALSTPAESITRKVVRSLEQDRRLDMKAELGPTVDIDERKQGVASLFSDDSPVQPLPHNDSAGPSRSPRYRSPLRDSDSDDSHISNDGDAIQDPPSPSRTASYQGSPLSPRLNTRPVPSFPQAPRSQSNKHRYDRLKALAESRKNPQTPRTARAATRSHGRSTRSQFMVLGRSSEEEEEEEEGEDEEAQEEEADYYDLGKHYDTSLGSLKDFIVDDSDLSGEDGHIDMLEDSEDDLDDILEPPRRTDPIAKKNLKSEGCRHGDQSVKHVVDSDTDDGDEVAVEIPQYTPPGLSNDLPDFSRLTLYDDDDDEQKLSEDVQLVGGRRKKKSPIKRDERGWKLERERIARKIFDELDRRVFDKKLSEASIAWNKRLLTTAGKAHCRREKHPDGTRKLTGRIELSEKVLTGEEQILSTVAHEMCHQWKNPHGRVFRSWGRKVMRARPDIEVTTTHNYTIEYKYRWKCSNEKCSVTYRRHSKSIDVEKERCWSCGNNLIPLFETKASNPFQTYLKENMKYAKTAMPGATHGEVMRALSRQWQDAPGADHRGHWKAIAEAQA